MKFLGTKVNDETSFDRVFELFRTTLDVARLLRSGPVEVEVLGWQQLVRRWPLRARRLRDWLQGLEASDAIVLRGERLASLAPPMRRSSMSSLAAVKPSVPPAR